MEEKELSSFRKAVIVALGVLMASSVTFHTWGDMLEHVLYDSMFLARGVKPPPEEVIVVAIDEPSLDVMKEQWPWPRSRHASLLRALKRGGAAVVVFDILFSEPSDPEQDADFAAAIDEMGEVILASDWVVVDDPMFRQELRIEPIPELMGEKTGLGLITVPTDQDGFVRMVIVAYQELLAIGLKGAQDYGKITNRKLSDWPDRSVALLNFYGPARTIPTVSYYQALEPESHLPKDFFKDKLVLVGLASRTVVSDNVFQRDVFGTPFSRNEAGLFLPGVEIHATLAANIIRDGIIRRLDPSTTLVIGIIFSFIVGFYFFDVAPHRGLIAVTGIMILFFISSLAAFENSGKYFTITHWLLPLIGAYSPSPFVHFLAMRKQRKFIRQTFSRYLAPDIVEVLLKHPDRLKAGGESVDATALFLDLQGFTGLSENLPPNDVVEMLNRTVGSTPDIVFKWKGFVDKFVGDAVMCVWGVPIVTDRNHAEDACGAALEMRERLHELFKQEFDSSGLRLGLRIGINSGRMIAGNVGSQAHLNYTVIGSAVNTASRLEGANKFYGTEIMLGEDTASKVGRGYVLRKLDKVKLVGQASSVWVYELVGLRAELDEEVIDALASYEQGLQYYAARDWFKASDCFSNALKIFRDDKPSKVLLERCQLFSERDVPEEWDGSYSLTSK